MYKVFKVGDAWQVFWVESPDTEPVLVPRPTDILEDKYKPYPKRQAAYRRCKKLNDAIKEVEQMIKRDGAIIL